MQPDSHEQQEVKQFLEENQKLLEENNAILKKIHRNALWTFWIRVFWYAVLIGLPFALYFYIVEPYFEAFGSDYDKFIDGLNELPGLKGIDQLMDTWNGGDA